MTDRPPQAPDSTMSIELDIAWAFDPEDENGIRLQNQHLGQVLVFKLNQYQRIQVLYDQSNETARRAMAQVVHVIKLIATVQQAAVLVIAGNNAFVNGTRLKLNRKISEAVEQLGQQFETHGIGGIRFGNDADEAAIDLLSRLLAASAAPQDARDHMTRALQDAGVESLGLLAPKRVATADESTVALTDTHEAGLELYADGLLTLDMASASGPDNGIIRRRQAGIVRRFIELGEDRPDSMLALSAHRRREWPAESHSMNVMLLAIAMGMKLGLKRQHLMQLGLCAMHANVGEGFLPTGMLRHPRPLLPEEIETVHEHPALGFALLLDRHGFSLSAMERALVSLEHHIDMDLGGGYPDVPRPRLHPYSRIVAVCDVYDALVSDRPHRPAYPPDQAVKIVVRGSGSRFDPLICQLLVQVVGHYPPGSVVELDTGELAVVYGAGDGPAPMIRPRVVLFRDLLGQELPPRLVDLHARLPRRRAFKRSIVRPIDPRKLAIQPAGYLFHPDLLTTDPTHHE